MFDPQVLVTLAKRHRPVFEQLSKVEDALNRRFTEAEEPIRALVLAVASGEPLLLIGPPGTGKSRLIRAFCGMTGLLREDKPDRDRSGQEGRESGDSAYFEYLLTPFTEPGELFGYYDIPKAIKGDLVRMDQGMMQHAKVVYLDEVFNGSSAILNSILAFMNERIFYDRGMRRPVALESLFAATNHLPESTELLALYDRFLLRCKVRQIDAKVSALGNLLQKGWQETYADHDREESMAGIWPAVAGFREEVRAATTQGYLKPAPNHAFYKRMTQLVQHARQYDLSEMSNRRLVKMTYLMMVHCIYEAVCQGELKGPISLGERQLQLLPRYFLDRGDVETVQKLERAASF